MARKITVVNDASHIKKSVAQLLVRRLLAEWVVINVSIRRLAVRELPRMIPDWRSASGPYIPERMPPVEVGGCHFQEPQSDSWKKQHRMVRFPSTP